MPHCVIHLIHRKFIKKCVKNILPINTVVLTELKYFPSKSDLTLALMPKCNGSNLYLNE